MANNCENFLRITTTVNPQEFVSGLKERNLSDLPEDYEGFGASDLFAEEEFDPEDGEAIGMGYRLGIYQSDGQLHIEPPFGNTWYVECYFDTRWGPNVEFLERLYSFLSKKDPDASVSCMYFEPGCQLGGHWCDDAQDDDGWPLCEFSDTLDLYVFPDGFSAPDWFDRFYDWRNVARWKEEVVEWETMDDPDFVNEREAILALYTHSIG